MKTIKQITSVFIAMTLLLTIAPPTTVSAITTEKSVSKASAVKVSKITLNKSKISIKKGKTYKLKATAKPSTATNKAVKWTSSNKKIATVSSKGVVKGVSKGKAVITCKAKDGSKKTAKCTVYVNKPIPDEMKVEGRAYGEKVCEGVNEVREMDGFAPLTYDGHGSLMDRCKEMAKGGKLPKYVMQKR